MRKLLIILLIAAGCSSHEQTPRPNILFAFADDLGKYASCYADQPGNGVWQQMLSTPAIDRIADEGVLFNNAHVNAPSCTPCRSSILSGQYFYRTNLGAILQGAIWDDSIPTYPLLLEKAGYHIGFTYKVWSPGTPKDAGYGGERTKFEPAGTRFRQFSQNVYKMHEAGKSFDEAKQELFDEVHANFQAFLDAREEGKPFAYWFGPTNTHRKWIAGSGKELWNMNPDRLEFCRQTYNIEHTIQFTGDGKEMDQAMEITGGDRYAVVRPCVGEGLGAEGLRHEADLVARTGHAVPHHDGARHALCIQIVHNIRGVRIAIDRDDRLCSRFRKQLQTVEPNRNDCDCNVFAGLQRDW